MARHSNPGSSTNRTIDALDRKRERERQIMLLRARDNASELAAALVQTMLDQRILETNDVQTISQAIEEQLKLMCDLEEFELQYKIAPLRLLTQDPNVCSLFITQYVVEDLIDHPNIQDIFGDDMDIYNAVDSILSKIRP
ncbi:MAG: hypothetical protein CSA34_07290 [Desulfobulbus propionicus]|nr:MAG: hypothetical protein CSA34_07290 [Desulfobulbus propionicus]